MKDCFIIESKDLLGVCILDEENERNCMVVYKTKKGERDSYGRCKVQWAKTFITCEKDIPIFYA